MDDQLRALERAARAAPDDRAAGRALVRGLERSGDEKGAWRERCRLARAGDDEAWAALEWRPRGARTAGERAERRLPGGTELLSAGPGEVVLSSRSQLLALDPGTLETRWSRPIARGPRAPACASGPWVVHVEGAEAEPTIVVTGRRTGEELVRRAAQGGPEGLVSVVWAELTADRLGVLARSAEPPGRWRHVVLAPAEGLVVLHQVELQDPVLPPVLARDLLLEKLPLAPALTPAGFTPSGWVARSLDGQERWRAPGALLGHRGGGVLLARSGADGVLGLCELDLTGRARWSRDVPSCKAHLGPDHVLLAEDPYRRGGETVLRLSTLERAAGRPGWERVMTGPPEARLGGLAATGDVAHALLRHELAGAPASASLEAIDMRSGLTRWSAEVPLVGPRVSIHPVEDGLLVVDQSVGEGDGETVLHRLGAP